MALFEHLPYTNFHELNLEDLTRLTRECLDELQKWTGDVDRAVAEYISDHPEIMITANSVYTAAIQDGAVTKAKLDPDLQTELGYYVTPQQFGAAGDGATDDRDAFQAAFDSGFDVYIPTDHGETYKIVGPAPVDVGGVPVEQPALIWRNTVQDPAHPEDPSKRIAAGRKLYGLGNWRTVGTRGAIVFYPYNNSLTQPLIRVEEGVQGFHIANLRFKNSMSSNRGVFLDAATSSTIDKDIIINDCSIVDFTLGIDFKGRGLTCYQDSFNSCTDAVHVNYDGDDTYQSRAIWFENCRFHTVTEKVIDIQSGCAWGLMINNCLCDNGVKMFLHSAAGVTGKNWMITNNTLQDMDRKTNFLYTILLQGSIDDIIISGNMFDSRSISNAPTSVIRFEGPVTGAVIQGNRIDRLYYNNDPQHASATYRAIVFVGTASNVVINGNNAAGIQPTQFLFTVAANQGTRFCVTGNVTTGGIKPATATLLNSVVDNNVSA